ncbi:unnamed protein product [Paramecium sonneborni]|uniref:Uncharacterized protein n=1 Tax=Paramecium sonneborni TaxID=65129 RepID=A0A8S1RPY0_9CILI|nr:unnamed protein product [Paramecium sonneborni]
MNCPDHHLNLIPLICESNHKCQRKLRVKCQYDQGVDIKFTVPLNKFREKMDRKLLTYKLIDGSSEIIELRIEFKQLLSQIEITIKQLWEDLSESIKQIYDIIEQENQSYIDLIKKMKILHNLVIRNQKGQLIFWKAKPQMIGILKRILICRNCKKFSYGQIVKNQNQEQYIWKEGTEEYIGIIWDYEYDPPRPTKTKFQITFTKDKQILYLRDEQIIRTYLFYSYIKFIESNLKTIQGNQKKLESNWNGQIQKDVGGLYLIDGKKSGLWRDLIKNFWTKAQAYEVGEYTNDKRQGIWKYIYMDKEIGGGEYNNQGEKNGKWIELSEEFYQHSQVTYKGEYLNVKKLVMGYFLQGEIQEYQQFSGSGGGSYDEGSIKIGRWINDDSQVTYIGEYKIGKKIDRWDIVAWARKIGGGSYTERDSIKIGNWIELN